MWVLVPPRGPCTPPTVPLNSSQTGHLLFVPVDPLNWCRCTKVGLSLFKRPWLRLRGLFTGFSLRPVGTQLTLSWPGLGLVSTLIGFNGCCHDYSTDVSSLPVGFPDSQTACCSCSPGYIPNPAPVSPLSVWRRHTTGSAMNTCLELFSRSTTKTWYFLLHRLFSMSNSLNNCTEIYRLHWSRVVNSGTAPNIITIILPWFQSLAPSK